MAIGEKLGKVFGALGSGLSFIPGPWSAVGMALSAGGQVASSVGAAKDRRQAEQEEQAKIQQEQAIAAQQAATAGAQVERAQRPEAGIAPGAATPQPQPPQRNTFQPGRVNAIPGTEDLVEQSVVQMILRDGGLGGL